MSTAKIDRRIRNTKATLRNTLIDLLQDKPVGRIRVKEICEKAGINRGTFYAHYTDVQDLQEQVFREFLARVGELMDSADALPGSPESIAKLTRILRYAYDNRRLVLTLLGENSSISSHDAILRFLLEKKIFDRFQVPSELESYLYHYTAGGCVSLLLEWMANGSESPETIARLVIQMTAAGLSDFTS